MYRNSRLKHVKNIENIAKTISHWSPQVKIVAKQILDQCNLLLETKKKKKAKKYSLGKVFGFAGVDDLHLHVSDGKVYLSNPPKWRCKVCGKFFCKTISFE